MPAAGVPGQGGAEALPPSPFAEVARAAEAEAERLRREGVVSEAFLGELDERFEAAARRALRVPVLAERSARLRRVARALVPAPAKPLARRVVAGLDRRLRAAFERLEAKAGR